MARRVNKKFLTILSLVIMGGLIALVALPKLRKQDTKVLWERADKQAAIARDQKTPEAYKAAKELYYKAYRADQANVEGLVKFGDLLHESVRFDLDDMRKDLVMWDQALQVDPRYVPALERIMNAFIEGCRILPSADGFKLLNEKAGALAKLQPNNIRAQSYEQIGIVGGWLSASPIKESDVEDSIKKLIELPKQVPDDVDIPWYIAKGSLRLAYNRATGNNPEEAKRLRDQAVTVMEDAMKARPENAGLAYRYYRIQIDLVDPKRSGDAEAREVDRLKRLLENARTLAKLTDDDYADTNISTAELLRQHGKAAEAEKIVADLLKARPDDQQVRFSMAHLWKMNPEKRPQAIELLSQPLGDDANRKGFRALLIRELEFRRLTELADLRLLSYDDTPEKDRPALREAIEQSYRQAVAVQSEPDNPTLLKLKGKIYLLSNDRQATVEAIRAMRAAYDKLEQRQMVDGELTYQLARLYYIVGETGQYKTLVVRLLDVRPNAHTARKDLVRLLLRDRFYDEAKKHIDFLDKNLKDDPDTVRLRLAYLLGTNDLKTVQSMVSGLGESTGPQKIVKATALMVSGDTDRAEKLLLPLVKTESENNFDETNASQTLIRLYFKLARKEDAGKLADQVVAKKPKDRVFRLLALAARDKATPEELNKFRDELNLEISDPIVRELDNYWTLRKQGKPAADLEKMLAQLDQKYPNDGKVVETLFNHGIDFGNFKMASDAADRLEKLNWDQVEGLYFHTRLNIARRDGEAAMRTASAMSRRLPEFSRTWVLMGQAQELNRQYESAVSSVTKALDIQLENFEALP